MKYTATETENLYTAQTKRARSKPNEHIQQENKIKQRLKQCQLQFITDILQCERWVGDCCCAHISKQRCKLGLEIQ